MPTFPRLIEEPTRDEYTTSRSEYGTRSETGRVRSNNEDSFIAAPELELYVLSDGMGGVSAGEVASRMTVERVAAYCREAHANGRMAGPRLRGVSQASNHLASAIRIANREIFQAAREHAEQRGMGATVVALLGQGERLSVAHVGDSRAYRLRDHRLERLTEDHSLVAERVRRGQMTEQEAGTSQTQNVLLRAVGVEPEVQVELSEEPLLRGDVLLLCSDGLTRELSDAQISAILKKQKSPQEAADVLVRAANEAGGGDNITAIVWKPALQGPGLLSGIGKLGKWFSA